MHNNERVIIYQYQEDTGHHPPDIKNNTELLRQLWQQTKITGGLNLSVYNIFVFYFIFSNQPQQFPARVELVNTFPKQTPGNSALLSRLS